MQKLMPTWCRQSPFGQRCPYDRIRAETVDLSPISDRQQPLQSSRSTLISVVDEGLVPS